MTSYGPFGSDHLDRDAPRAGGDLLAVRSRFCSTPSWVDSEHGFARALSAVLGRLRA